VPFEASPIFFRHTTYSGAKIKYTTFKKLLPQHCTKRSLWLVLCNVGTKPVVHFIFREAQKKARRTFRTPGIIMKHYIYRLAQEPKALVCQYHHAFCRYMRSGLQSVLQHAFGQARFIQRDRIVPLLAILFDRLDHPARNIADGQQVARSLR
jgi:hypothetical protein